MKLLHNLEYLLLILILTDINIFLTVGIRSGAMRKFVINCITNVNVCKFHALMMSNNNKYFCQPLPQNRPKENIVIFLQFHFL